jgi:uncharacterized protein (DUF1800 family)
VIACGALLATLLAASPAPAGGGAPARAFLSLREQRAQVRLWAGHLLRRLGFGPNRREMHEVLRLGRDAYLELQLHPERIDDRIGERSFVPEPRPNDGGLNWELRWMTRMAFSRRQLQEKMVLLWHEHFAISYLKIRYSVLMRDYERLLREHALGSFRDLLIGITTDNAMLLFLDNTQNDGRAVDGAGTPVPPNENYARELLQLYALGPNRLHMDGTPMLDLAGQPVPAYGESDVKEIARALTGWTANHPDTPVDGDPTLSIPPASFAADRHDPQPKMVLGEIIESDPEDPAADVERVVDVIMRQPTTAPFIAKELILKLATETPSPGYVERVATVFAGSGGDLRATVRAILSDAEFYSPAVVRSQYKTPIEHVVGALRGLGASGGRGRTLQYWATLGGQRPYDPPSVFSFYRPGAKGALVNASYVALRDRASDMLARGYRDFFFDAVWDAPAMIRRRRLRLQPGRAVDVLAEELLAAPPSPGLRQAVVDYIGAEVTETKLRGAAWLIMSSPEYQVN